MNVCRICLSRNVDKDLNDLKVSKENMNPASIMLFCLDIQVTQEMKISTKLCSNCYNKILEHYQFKTLALKNDLYLKSVCHASLNNDNNNGDDIIKIDDVKNEDIQLNHNGVNFVLKAEVKEENLVEDFSCSDDEFLIALQSVKYEELKIDTKDNAPSKKKKYCSKALIENEEIESNNKESEFYACGKKVKRRRLQHQHNGEITIKKKRGRPKVEKKLLTDKYVCYKCGKNVKNLKEHLERHQTNRKRIKCEMCDKTFLGVAGKNNHIKFKHLNIKDTCEICNKSVRCLSAHKRTMHSAAERPHGCVSCGRRFLTRSLLDYHMTLHTKDLKFQCDACGAKFRSKIALHHHIRRVHEKEKSHLCQFCSKGFFKKYHLQLHIRTHTKEKPHKCEECGKYFLSTSTLRSHQLIHSQQKNFECTQCNMTFLKRNYLSKHILIHTKEKRHQCQYCDARFGRTDHRNRHELTHQRHFRSS